MLIPIVNGEDSAGKYLDIIDGLLLSGGEDISPLLYGENPIKEMGVISEARDSQEYQLFQEALKLDMPVLGICRGIQLMNAVCGGTLFQDIFSQCKNVFGHNAVETPVDVPYHTVSIEKGSRLYDIFGTHELKVNSFHHQAIKKTAGNFKVAATSQDGIIEGIEDTEKTFVVGVQWHPEDLSAKHTEFLKLFKKFIDYADLYRRR